ncbi:TetR/AcrR family transcriptional regulator [Winogradskya humida]|uniref:TetR family transcriptional regulator n=1 Tax=Winogradskya humida TaxID=113566 RepID=A0ABQ3ZUQ2_9ACTN|nr:TetR/AcrR family transcriptional regulator [Actinoplanes humidus]GIE22269.1 TetR family transcriptional regulator [Actinoplanes humidus]
MRDVRTQLFDAAERVLVRAGVGALTSRAVTAEAGCAKGVLHKHFADFDEFLVELVLDRTTRVQARDVTLRAAAGTGTVAGNLADVLTELFTSVAVALVALIIARDELRARLWRAARQPRAGVPPVSYPKGITLLAEATAMLAGYLGAERDLGRIAPGADVEMVALTLIGSGHLLFAGRDGTPPDADEVLKMVNSAIAAARPAG